MSSTTMNLIYFITIALFGLAMVLSPRTFMGRAKFDEGAVKTEKLVKKSGIVLIVIQVLLIIYFLVK